MGQCTYVFTDVLKTPIAMPDIWSCTVGIQPDRIKISHTEITTKGEVSKSVAYIHLIYRNMPNKGAGRDSKVESDIMT